MPALIQLIIGLATTGAQVYAQMQGAGPNTKLVASLIPVAGQIAASISEAGDVLKKAQDEGWTDTDPRWDPVMDALVQKRKDIEAML